MYSVRLLYLIIMTLYQFLYFNLTYDLIVSHYFDNFFVNFIFLCHSYDLVWLDSVFHNWLLYLIFIMILLHSFTVKKWMVCFSLRLGLKCSLTSHLCADLSNSLISLNQCVVAVFYLQAIIIKKTQPSST